MLITKNTWSPCSHSNSELLEIVDTEEAYLLTKQGNKIIDAISSWWCKSLGHKHPKLHAAIRRQLQKFEHIIPAGTTNDLIETLSAQLLNYQKNMGKVMYASDGACAIEIAMKLALQAQAIRGFQKRNQFISLKHGYHGETLGALSVCGIATYKSPFTSILSKSTVIEDIPYVLSSRDASWFDVEDAWKKLLPKLEKISQKVAAIIVEPIVQGAAGMKFYSADFLYKLHCYARQQGIFFIADEVMTGLGRTGTFFASHHANISPDLICLSKALTGGYLPMSAVLVSDILHDTFYHQPGNLFSHSHTFSQNALAASVALEVLSIIEEEALVQKANQLGKIMLARMQEIASLTQCLKNVRQLGAIVAAELALQKGTMQRLYKEAITQGILLRPIGNTIYWLPPLNIKPEVLEEMAARTYQSIVNVL